MEMSWNFFRPKVYPRQNKYSRDLSDRYNTREIVSSNYGIEKEVLEVGSIDFINEIGLGIDADFCSTNYKFD